MKKKAVSTKNKKKVTAKSSNPILNDVSRIKNMAAMQQLSRMMNVTGTQSRDALLSSLFSRDIDMDHECRWPTEIATKDYKDLFERNSLAGRVVNIWPSECWILSPEIYEVESVEVETSFEKEWKKLNTDLNLIGNLYSLDILSGIGRFGIMFLGLNDIGANESFATPVKGVNPTTGEITGKLSHKLLYVKIFQEYDVSILEIEKSKSSPRYGKPTIYSIQMEGTSAGMKVTEKVHWSRILHVADNRLSSDIYGEPRMKPVWNDLIDVRKIKGGASEGYWRACLSGIAWGFDPALMDPNVTLLDTDKDTMRENLEDYYNSMQRYLFAGGLIPHDIAPKLIDPSPYVRTLIDLICIRLGIPVAVFMGREEGQLASQENRTAWLERVKGHQTGYTTPMLIRPFINMLMNYGVLPGIDEVQIYWPDRNSPSDKDIADTAVKLTQAMATYVSGNVNLLMGESTYFSQILKKTPDEIEDISQEIDDWEDLNNPEIEPVTTGSPINPNSPDNKVGE
jgi:hypothetical protein